MLHWLLDDYLPLILILLCSYLYILCNNIINKILRAIIDYLLGIRRDIVIDIRNFNDIPALTHPIKALTDRID
jgi:hypothetical protein